MEDYTCENCKEVWSYFPKDYERKRKDFICPHCAMPLSQMISNMYKEEGIIETIKQIIKRYL